MSKNVNPDKLIVLNGYIPDVGHPDRGHVQQLFTGNERATALHVTKLWNERGWSPKLFSKTADGKFVFLYNYKNHVKKTKLKLAA